MAIPQALADKVLAKCGRCCCICRRFAPLHLQVHHIDEQNQGGGDEEDNLIPICLTCHSDVHTQTKLSRRFTINELKLHRSEVFRLVGEGKLPAGNPTSTDHDAILAEILRRLGTQNIRAVEPTVSPPIRGLDPLAIDMLTTAATSGGGYLIIWHYDSGDVIMVGAKHYPPDGNHRGFASAKRALEDLMQLGLIENLGHSHGVPNFAVTEKGYLFADQILASSQ